MVSSLTLVLEMVKYGIAGSIVIGIFYLIYWSVKRNIKLLFSKMTHKELVSWIKDGLRKRYTEEELSKILVEKGFKIKLILNSLRKAKQQLKKEKMLRDDRINKVLKDLDEKNMKGGK